jgi:uracil-DNA glycosylase
MPSFSESCRRCARLARHLALVRAEHPDYHGRPVPSFGPTRARLLIVGLAPGMHGANRTGRPFTGDDAGILLYDTLHRFGFANRPVSVGSRDGLRLEACRITNAVRCLPPANRPRPDEVRRCNLYLREEIDDLRDGAAILALGGIAHRAVLMALGARATVMGFRHGARYPLARDLMLFDSYHCSRYNTQTRRLTPDMFRDIVAAVAEYLTCPTSISVSPAPSRASRSAR